MKYYEITSHQQQKVCGTYPQATPITDGVLKDYEITKNNILKSKNQFYCVMYKNAILTDIISVMCGTHELQIISIQLLDFIESYCESPIIKIPIDVIKDNLTYKYFLFGFEEDMNENIINYQKSIFRKMTNDQFHNCLDDHSQYQNYEQIVIMNHEEYLNTITTLESGLRIGIEKYCIRKSFNKHFFYSSGSDYLFSDGFYVSEILKKKIENSDFNGILFLEMIDYDSKQKFIFE